MLTFGELQQAPDRASELGGCHVLIAALGTGEVLVEEQTRGPEETMVFMHETIEMMRAERAERIGQLRTLLGDSSMVIPLQKKDESFWDHITVGRASTADIVLDDPATSNVHAHFEDLEGGEGISLQDLGSSNGTFLNRQQVQAHIPAQLKSGDCIRFGQSIFYFVSNSLLKELAS